VTRREGKERVGMERGNEGEEKKEKGRRWLVR